MTRAESRTAIAVKPIRFFASILSALMLIIMWPVQSLAQSNVDGSIYGNAGGASLSVVAEATSLGVRRTTTSDGDGEFRIPGLPVGEYTLTVYEGESAVRTAKVKVQVGVGSLVTFGAGPGGATELDAITVTASQITPIDYSQTESTIVFSDRQVEAIPVPRNITNVALLAPGTTQGDPNFGNFASFGGASVAENAYYVNGFNITNFRNGLGFSEVPFEFLQQFQIKTGGYGAEFGRSVGGVVNTTTKRGNNTWEFGASAYYEPDGLRERPPSSFKPDGSPYVDNRQDVFEESNTNLYGGGPIIKDRLFIYGLAQFRQVIDDDVTGEGAQLDQTTSDDPFYGLKLDFNIFDGHSIDATYFKDQRKKTIVAYDNVVQDSTAPGYDPAFDTFGTPIGVSYEKRGGENYIFHYGGHFPGGVGVSAMYGHGEFDLTDEGSQDGCPLAIDVRTSATSSFIGCWVGSGLISTADDSRNAYRFDVEVPLANVVGDHVFKVGYDFEDNESNDKTSYSGGIYYRYVDLTPSSTLNGGTVPGDVTEGVRIRFYNVGGHFVTRNSALYVEDTWQPIDTLTLRLGLRNETFENLNKNDQTFIEIKDQLAPRLGLSWDPTGEQKSQIFANVGRYYLPIVANTNVRLAGGELFTQAYYQCGPDGAAETCQYDPATGAPLNQGSEIGTTQVLSDGTIPDVRTIVNTDIKPMYQDEFILGFRTELAQNWTGGVAFIWRELGRSIEDIIVNQGLHAYAQRNGLDESNIDGSDHYLLTNPGEGVATAFDFDGDGTLEAVYLNPEDLHFPEAKRRYNGVELSIERVHTSKWYMQGSYTWSQSYGNSEGLVRSDNDQDDAGITTQFDYPRLAVGADGYLPNDRRHQIKLYGTYDLVQTFTVGAHVNIASGRPLNTFGDVRAADGDPYDPATGATYVSSTYVDDVFRGSRGSRGRTDWLIDFDLSARWKSAQVPGLWIGGDIFNVLGRETATQQNEVYQNSTNNEERFGLTNGWQAPRRVRLSAGYDFGL